LNAKRGKIIIGIRIAVVLIASGRLTPNGYAGGTGISSAAVESKEIALSLFKPADTGFTELAILVGFTPIVAAGDDELSEFVCRDNSFGESAPVNAYSDAVGLYCVPLAAGLWVTGRLADSDEIAVLGRDILVAQSLSLAACSVLKTVFGRARPATNEGSARFRPLTFDDKYSSFPSNHAAVAFATAATISTRYPNFYLAVTLYAAAAGVAYARVYNREHWPSDVFASAVIGIAIGRAAGAYGSSEKPNSESSIGLWIDPRSGYVGISYNI